MDTDHSLFLPTYCHVISSLHSIPFYTSDFHTSGIPHYNLLEIYNHLDFLFVKIGVQSKGIGQSIWKKIEELYPNTEIWETCTPYFDKRNIHFYVNRLGFHIVEYFNEKHPDPNMQLDCYKEDDGMFKFEKVMKK